MAEILNKLLARQLDPNSFMAALAEINNKTPKLQGTLLPANDPDPFPECRANEGQVKMVLGTVTFITAVSQNSIAVGERNRVAMRRTEDGISVDALLEGEDGNIAAVIRGNRFVLNSNNVFDVQTPDDSTLIVHSIRDDAEILNIRFLNKTTMMINAAFFVKPGMRIEVNEHGIQAVGAVRALLIDHGCFFNRGGIKISSE